MCWWANTLSCPTSKCVGYSLIDPVWVSQHDNDVRCPKPGCTDEKPCNKREKPRAIPSSLHPEYRRLCNDCLSGVDNRWKISPPRKETLCKKCGRQFVSEFLCRSHVNDICPKRGGDMFGRMRVTIWDVHPENDFVLPRIEGPAVEQRRVWPVPTPLQQSNMLSPALRAQRSLPQPTKSTSSTTAMESSAGPSRRTEPTITDSRKPSSRSTRQAS